jgi:hypothetical protein
MNNITPVNDTGYINSAEFVKLKLHLSAGGYEVYTFSSSYKEETIDGLVYNPLSGLLGISTQQRDLKATSFDTSISLSGVDQNNIYIVLSDQYTLKGSEVTIYRGFYDANYNLLPTVYTRYTGIVTSYTIQESVSMDDRTDTYTVAFNCSNFRTILENHVSGRNTNPTSWKLYDDADNSMINVPNLMNAYFNFGKKV